MITDESIYQRYLDGEGNAADLLVERYGDMLTLYINGYIKDIHEAEDLIYKTARNLALRHKRKHRILFSRIEDLDFEPPGKMLADTEILRNERDRQLYEALDKLKPEYREALYLIYFEDLSYRSAATVVSKSEQQIKNLVYRGKQSLKTILEQGGFVYADE